MPQSSFIKFPIFSSSYSENPMDIWYLVIMRYNKENEILSEYSNFLEKIHKFRYLKQQFIPHGNQVNIAKAY